MNNRRGNAIGPIIVLILVVAICIYIFTQSSSGSGGTSSHISDYMAMLDNGQNTKRTDAVPEIPAVIVDYEMKRIDELCPKLPNKMITNMHAEVKTVIVLIRGSSGIPSASVGLAIASSNAGYYNIGAFVFDAQGTLLKSHSVNKKGAMSGAGEEAELHAQANQEMLDWIIETLGG